MKSDWLKKIAAPAAEFRGAPFWAWNAQLEPEELRRQIRAMKQMGLGGFFMHARTGLDTEYLGAEWFECVRACVDEAKNQQMLAWLYDEDRWPSGAAGGLVTVEERFRMRALSVVAGAAAAAADQLWLARFAARLEGNRIFAPRRLAPDETAVRPGETLLGFKVVVCKTSSWYNDQAYLDTMNPEAVAKFIEITHEAYYRELGAEFGKTIPGIFTDEPNYAHIVADGPVLPWTEAVPERFRERYGYDLLDHLPELVGYVDGRRFAKARLDYRNLVTDLFVNAFTRQIGEWCEQHNLESTGHMLREDFLVDQMSVVGAAMRHYEFMQAPGIDLLTEHWMVYDAAKQCSSMARQFGRTRRLTETYGCTGWDFPFAGHKALGDWQYALGINYRSQHLAWYSMAAEAKRDYPASIFDQSPWAAVYGLVEDYFGRLGAALSEGEERRELLVIHPIESTFGAAVVLEWGEPPAPTLEPAELAAEDQRLIAPRNALLRANLDFDYGDEDVLARHGAVSGATLQVGHATYRAVLIPELLTIRSTTLELLREFQAGGGTVAYCGAPPELLDGEPSAKPGAVYAQFTAVTLAEAAAALEPAARSVSLTEPGGGQIATLLHQIRRGEGIATLFVCNTALEHGSFDELNAPLVRDRSLAFPEVEVAWCGAAADAIFELELTSGAIRPVASRFVAGCHRFTTALPALGSRLFFAAPDNLATAPALPPRMATSAVPFAPEWWAIELDDPNVLVLDHARYALDGGELAGPEFILALDDRLRELLGCRPRGGAMVQPYLGRGRQPARRLALTLEYRFNCAAVPAALELGIERPELYRIELNGRPVSATDCGYWCDRSLRKLALPTAALQVGENRLTLSCEYHELLGGLEALFLLGDFGVTGVDTLTAPPRTLQIGDWCEQGLPNYAGNVTYRADFESADAACGLRLVFGEWRGAALGVRLNGGVQQLLGWPPYELELEGLRSGRNTLEITVFGHRRNSHGPFYCQEKWPVWTGPAQMKCYDHPERQLVPCGLLTMPQLRR